MRRALAACALAFAALPAAACTTFCVRGPDGLVFGRNYDFFTGEGMVLANGRGVDKSSTLERQPARWTSKYGSVTFNQFGRDNPMGGVNERGLVVELMELPETRYPDADSRPALGVLEWIQYVLDNFATVDEALAGAKRVRIATRMGNHYLLADRGGDVAVVEFLGGRMVVRRGDTLPSAVLANSPYDESLAHASSHPQRPAELPRGSLGSLERFARAQQAVRAIDGLPLEKRIDRSFGILDEVAQAGHTRWQIVYDLSRSTIHYRTTANRERRSLSIASFDYACRATPLMLDIDSGHGDVTKAMMPYAPEANERQMLRAFGAVPQLGMSPEQVRAEASQIEKSRRCVAAAG